MARRVLMMGGIKDGEVCCVDQSRDSLQVYEGDGSVSCVVSSSDGAKYGIVEYRIRKVGQRIKLRRGANLYREAYIALHQDIPHGELGNTANVF